ncbi:hypothetical protein ACFZAV_45255, partial [Streptomyces sp. NPDC008343]|uniref:hypothetical protein n=1 Tax=Streptomyces sp. NPDC008343 TaxID=3364828 RepID=UPI0036EB5314
AFTILSTAGAALDIGVTALKGITKAKQIYSSSAKQMHSPSNEFKAHAFNAVNSVEPGAAASPIIVQRVDDIVYNPDDLLHRALKEKNGKLVDSYAFVQQSMADVGIADPETLRRMRSFQDDVIAPDLTAYQQLFFELSSTRLNLPPHVFPHVSFVEQNGQLAMTSHFAGPRNADSPWHAATAAHGTLTAS